MPVDAETRAAIVQEIQAFTRGPAFDSNITPKGVTGRKVELNEVTDLPLSPEHGDEVLLVVEPGAGPIWHLRYSKFLDPPYQWHFMGGAPMRDLKEASNSFATSTFTTGSPEGPTLTAPLAGTYRVHWGARCFHDTAAGFGHMGIKNGSAATTAAESLLFQTAANYNDMKSYTRNITATDGAGTVFLAEYSNGSGVGLFHQYYDANGGGAFLEITPVTVGRT